MERISSRKFVNEITRENIVQPEPRDSEKSYDGKSMITETDISGVITYASRRFCELTGYDRKILVGMAHSVVRHPEMPVGLFKGLWNTILDKKVWRGYIKNLCRDGSYFWALVYIQPKVNDDGDIVGFIANRKEVNPKELEEVKEYYARYRGPEYIDHPYFKKFALYLREETAGFNRYI